MKYMTSTEIRAEIVELINGGMLNVPNIVKFFKTYRPTANTVRVKEEAKELVAEVRMIIKRGFLPFAEATARIAFTSPKCLVCSK